MYIAGAKVLADDGGQSGANALCRHEEETVDTVTDTETCHSKVAIINDDGVQYDEAQGYTRVTDGSWDTDLNKLKHGLAMNLQIDRVNLDQIHAKADPIDAIQGERNLGQDCGDGSTFDPQSESEDEDGIKDDIQDGAAAVDHCRGHGVALSLVDGEEYVHHEHERHVDEHDSLVSH